MITANQETKARAMVNSITCLDIAYAAELEGEKQIGEEIYFCCPNHDDSNPSLRISPEKDAWICDPCTASGDGNAGGGYWRLAAFIAGVEPADKHAVLDWLGEHGLIKEPDIVEEYDYTDEDGHLLFQVVRFEPKDFRMRRPDGNGGWIWNLRGVDRVLYGLPDLKAASPEELIFVVEGEKDVESLRDKGLVATCNPGGAGKWRDSYLDYLIGRHCVILADNDDAGRNHALQVAESLLGKAASVKMPVLPGLHEKGDITDWLELGHSGHELLALVSDTPTFTGEVRSTERSRPRSTPWDDAQSAEDFLNSAEVEPEWLAYPLVARGCITELNSPRGVGKTQKAHSMAVALALKGVRVLLLDRDNPPHVVRKRLSAWGAGKDTPTLRVMTRDQIPSLTDTNAWQSFPYTDYDLVIIDSFDAAAEGIGEKDSAKPSRAIAPLLDIAHRDGGPGVLVLCNTIKTGTHGRGSGVIEDRADIVFEVRDATGLKPTGNKPWWEELPEAGRDAWAKQATRRNTRSVFRIAFIASKFRIGEQPEPFVSEVNVSGENWTIRDVTEEVVSGAIQLSQQEKQERENRMKAAVDDLAVEIKRKADSGNPMLVDKDAIPFLRGRGFTKQEARDVIYICGYSCGWRIELQRNKKGKPKFLFPKTDKGPREQKQMGTAEIR